VLLARLQPFVSLCKSTLGSLTGALGGLTLLYRIIALSGLLASPSVRLSEPSGPLQLVCGSGQHRGELLGVPPRLPQHDTSIADHALGGTWVHQLGPSRLQLRPPALILGHLMLQPSPIRIVLIFPKPGGALMILRRLFVARSSLTMVCRRIAHYSQQYEAWRLIRSAATAWDEQRGPTSGAPPTPSDRLA
jgi:hypothetical protein